MDLAGEFGSKMDYFLWEGYLMRAPGCTTLVVFHFYGPHQVPGLQT
jgi:hypothetical protein